jgi:pimeloyl-ACP methyl ester carboxylesterase
MNKVIPDEQDISEISPHEYPNSTIKEIDYAQHKYCTVNDAEYCYLESGQGPMLLMIHGYPDNAYSWEHQIRYFSQNGFRVIAPFTRGYLPTKTNSDSFFDRATLANDMAKLIELLNANKPAYLVGQDWGAAIGYGILGAFPHLVKRAVLLAVPHPVEIMRTLKSSPEHIIRSFHWFLFQFQGIPEFVINANKGKFLKWLWRIWSHNSSNQQSLQDRQHIDHIVTSMLQGTSVTDTLAYYRAALQSKYRDPQLAQVWERLNYPISVPTRVLCGQQDMRREMLPRQTDLFTPEAQFNWQLVNNAGHFLHREQPDIVNTGIIEWLNSREIL